MNDEIQVVAKLKFGSHLYGTMTPLSDTDYKTIFVPNFKKYVLGTSQRPFKIKKFPDGSIAGPNDIMDTGCVEEEFIPVPEFFKMLAAGEVQSMETFFAILQNKIEFVDPEFYNLCLQFEKDYIREVPVYNMVAFAKKSTIDYVLRSERLASVSAIINFLCEIFIQIPSSINCKLGSEVDGKSIIEHLKDKNFNDVSFGELQVYKNSTEKIESFSIASRTFGATTPLSNVIESLCALEKKYGYRVAKIEGAVEWKSMAHSVRTYQQAIEFIETNKITFPRPNIDELLKIRHGEIGEDEISNKLRELDKMVETLTKKKPLDISEFICGPVFDFLVSRNFPNIDRG